MKCVNCGRDRPESSGTMLKLTEEDQRLIGSASGETPPAELFYCKPCYGVLTDREMGARLISGQLEVRLRLANHPRARQVAEALYKYLIERSKNKQVS
jgi:hypothetical protein